MLDILKWIFAAFLLASSCWAAPVPPSGFKFLGQPAFASGLFRGLDASSSSVAAHTIDGYIQQTRLYSTMQSQIVRAMSYQCVSSNTWIALLIAPPTYQLECHPSILSSAACFDSMETFYASHTLLQAMEFALALNTFHQEVVAITPSSSAPILS